MGAGRDGATALAIIQAAHSYGLRGRAVRLELQDIDYLKPGAILHWRLSHFVVLDRIRRNGIDVVDPALGRRFVPTSELGRCFTGVALEFEASVPLHQGPSERSRVWEYARKIVRHSGVLGRIIVLSAFAQVLGLALPLMTGAIVDRVVLRADVNFLEILGLGTVALSVFGFGNSLLRAQLLLHLQTNLDLSLTLDFLDHMLRLPFSFFQVRQTGDLMMRLNSNATIREILTSSVLSGLLDGVMVSSYLLILLMTHLQLGLLIVGLGVLRVGIYVATRKSIANAFDMPSRVVAISSGFR